MNTSDQGLAILEDRESKRNAAYLDSKGIPTIGVGHTGPEVRLGLLWSNAQVDAVFRADIAWAEAAVIGCVKVPLSQNEFDALVSFTFECGRYALPYGDHGGPCSILRALNAGDHAGAAEAFKNWCNPPEVTSRRMGEMHQFIGDRFAARIDSNGESV